MTAPDPDPQHVEVAEAAISALSGYSELAASLATQETTGRSLDGRVTVRANGGGALMGVDFQAGTLSRYSSEELGEIVTEAIRETQLRARRQFEAAMTDAIPDEARLAHQMIVESGPS